MIVEEFIEKNILNFFTILLSRKHLGP
uniref:Uncharacterized protein n=1 Tax=Lepeophtheirus salmonis TaxID=72036 RepID=A0A0K2V326_LEPSM